MIGLWVYIFTFNKLRTHLFCLFCEWYIACIKNVAIWNQTHFTKPHIQTSSPASCSFFIGKVLHDSHLVTTQEWDTLKEREDSTKHPFVALLTQTGMWTWVLWEVRQSFTVLSRLPCSSDACGGVEEKTTCFVIWCPSWFYVWVRIRVGVRLVWGWVSVGVKISIGNRVGLGLGLGLYLRLELGLGFWGSSCATSPKFDVDVCWGFLMNLQVSPRL